MNPSAPPQDPPVSISWNGHVAVVELQRPPHNFFDLAVLQVLADSFEALDADPACRAIVLAAQGKSFCAGANLGGSTQAASSSAQAYGHAVRLFAIGKPVVAAVHGAAVGGGLGLALVADFRVTCPEARWLANFARLGFHPGFGISVTLPRLIGQQQAAMMLLTGRRVGGEEAVRIGLADLLVPQDAVRSASLELARELAAGAPIAVQDTRRTLRGDLAEQVRRATQHESALQAQHALTEDCIEGIAAAAQRREPVFNGR